MQIHQQGMHVYLAAAGSKTGALRPVRKDLAALADRRIVQLVSIELGTQSGEAHWYPMARTEEGYLPAAAAIYQDYCRSGENEACPANPANEFELWWPARSGQLDCAKLEVSSRTDCGSVSSPAYLRGAKLAYNAFLGTAAADLRSSEIDPIPLPFLPTFTWSEIVEGRISAERAEALAGATIFYGLNLALVRDDVYSPVYGAPDRRYVPGIYYHATAFDNLVALGDQRIDPHLPFGLSSTSGVAISIFLCCIACLIFKRLVQIARPNIVNLHWMLEILIFAIAAIMIATVQFALFHTSPGNWMGVIISITAAKLVAADWLADTIRGMPQRLRFLFKRVFG